MLAVGQAHAHEPDDAVAAREAECHRFGRAWGQRAAGNPALAGQDAAGAQFVGKAGDGGEHLLHPPGDGGSRPLAAAEQAVLGQRVKRAAQRDAADAEPVGEAAFAGQAARRPGDAKAQRLGQGVVEPAVERAGVVGAGKC